MSERNAGCPRVDTPETPSKSLIAQQLATDWSADAGTKLSDTQAINLIARELSGEEWNADTFDVIAAYVRGTGRSIDEPSVDTVETRREQS